MMRRKICLGFLSFLVTASLAAFTTKVISVLDGDTIEESQGLQEGTKRTGAGPLRPDSSQFARARGT